MRLQRSSFGSTSVTVTFSPLVSSRVVHAPDPRAKVLFAHGEPASDDEDVKSNVLAGLPAGDLLDDGQRAELGDGSRTGRRGSAGPRRWRTRSSAALRRWAGQAVAVATGTNPLRTSRNDSPPWVRVVVGDLVGEVEQVVAAPRRPEFGVSSSVQGNCSVFGAVKPLSTTFNVPTK